MAEKSDLPEFEFDADDLILRHDLTIPGAVASVAPTVERIMESQRFSLGSTGPLEARPGRIVRDTAEGDGILASTPASGS
jgi:hypothetical protein